MRCITEILDRLQYDDPEHDYFSISLEDAAGLPPLDDEPEDPTIIITKFDWSHRLPPAA